MIALEEFLDRLLRLLVDHGLLERSPDGAEYRMGFPPAGMAFELEDFDVRATTAAYPEHERREADRRRRSR